MQVQNVDHMFNFTFEKTADEIVTHARTKVQSIRVKIEERTVRIRKMREEHKITDAVLLDIQNQMRADAKRGMAAQYSSNARSDGGAGDETVTVGAGVINFILTEQDFIGGEKAQAERLDTIIRNLRPLTRRTANGNEYVELFKLGYEELKFLGF